MICNDRQLGICKCRENRNSWCSRYNQFTFCCSHKNLFPSFTYNIIEKLDENSYLIWPQQVEPFLSRNFPLIHLRIQSCARYRESYVQYLGTTSNILHKVFGCHHSWQLREKIHHHFQFKTKSKGHKFRTELRLTKKGDVPL